MSADDALPPGAYEAAVQEWGRTYRLNAALLAAAPFIRADDRSALASADNAIGQVLRHAWSWQEAGGHLEASEVARVLLLVLDGWTGRAEKRSDEEEAASPLAAELDGQLALPGVTP